jgi:hypothetical protein
MKDDLERGKAATLRDAARVLGKFYTQILPGILRAFASYTQLQLTPHRRMYKLPPICKVRKRTPRRL